MISITITDPHNLSHEERERLVLYLCPELITAELAIEQSPASIPEFLRKIADQPQVSSPSPSTDAAAPPPPPAVATVPPVPRTPAVPPSAPPAGVELDSAGLPWDSRIHAETHAKIGDGTWRYRRNCDKAVIAMVEEELRRTMGAAVPAPVAETPAAVPPVPPMDGKPLDAGNTSLVGTAAVPPAPTESVPAAPTATESAKTEDPGIAAFTALMEYVTPLMSANKITTAQMMEMVKGLGLPHIGALASRTDLIPEMRKKIDALVGTAA